MKSTIENAFEILEKCPGFSNTAVGTAFAIIKDEHENLRSSLDHHKEASAIAVDENKRLSAKVELLKKAYHYARNAAAGLTNYCEKSASTIKCEKELEVSENLYRQALAGEGEGDG